MPDVPFQLSLLGHFRLVGPDGPIDLGNKKLCALLAFICATSEPPSRATIVALLWGSHFEARAQHNLRQALTRLRQVLGNDAFVNIDNAIGLKPGLIRCDAASFETLIQAESHGTRKAAIDLYGGPFLANIVVSGSAWNDWVSARRRRLEDLAVAGLIRLSEEEEKLDAPLRALEFAQQAVALNDLREDGHRWGHLSIASNPAFTATFRYLAAALAAGDRLKEARDIASKLLELEPGFRLGLYERTRQPFRHAATKARYMEHLRKAGLPA